jgi:hypothetical protein
VAHHPGALIGGWVTAFLAHDPSSQHTQQLANRDGNGVNGLGGIPQAERALLTVEDPPPTSRWVPGRREGWKDKVSARGAGARQAREEPCSGPGCHGSASSDALTSSPSVTPAGIQYLELAGDRKRFNAWVGANKVPVKWSRRPGPQGIVSVVIKTVEGPFIVLHEGKIY